MRATATAVSIRIAVVCVSMLVKTVIPAKTAESIEMPFLMMLTRVKRGYVWAPPGEYD